ncbi:MAG: hypothetical protein FGM27_03830 [Candidatus Omnitrophica bacterium]|nr:hypothetical protein [Candidatus Omnitrophota bacterium]
MDKKSLYEKAEKAFNQAFEAAKMSVKTVSEKAGEAAQITRLLIEKAALEHRVTKKFAQLGSRVYDVARQESPALDFEEATLKNLLREIAEIESELSRVESALEKEERGKKTLNP